jgi:metallo-beta-lactamase family protein
MTSLEVTHSMEDSRRLNDLTGAAVIVAGSGMANAGRILHHLKHNLWRNNCHVVFVGFQAQGSTGRRLVDGAETVKIFREQIAVKAKIHTIGGFSGHADQVELVEWLRPQIHPGLKKVVLTHGEESGTLAFEKRLNELFPDLNTLVPHWLEVLEVSAERTPPPSAVEPAAIADEWNRSFQNRLERLSSLMASRAKPLDPADLANLESLLSQAEEMVGR